MKDGKYWSEALQTYIYIYKSSFTEECVCCHKLIKKGKGICFTRDDDPDDLEYVYGSGCIKKLALKKVKNN